MDIHTRFSHMHVPIQCYKVCVRFRFPHHIISALIAMGIISFS